MNLPRNVRRWCGAVVLAAVTVPATLAAQMPAAPVLQNAWTNAGITAAIDYSHAQATNAWAGALAWSPRQARFQLSIGGGVIKDSLTSHGGYGARIAIPLVGFAGGSIGTGVFGGVGYSSVAGMRESNFPVGLSLGWRHALGTTRGISAYVSPYWMTARFKQDADTALNATRSLVRAAVGVDITLASQLGLTVGYEDGGRAKAGEPGPRGGVFGIALSYALRRQQ